MTCRGRAVGVKPDGLGLGLSKGAWPGRGKQPGRDAGRRAGYVTKGRVEPGLEISHPLKVQRTQAQGVEGTLCNKEERGEPIREMGKLGGGLCRGRGFPRECEHARLGRPLSRGGCVP